MAKPTKRKKCDGIQFGKRIKVQAQRKFAQGAAVTPLPISKDASSTSSDLFKSQGKKPDFIVQNSPKMYTEDFLTYLCYKGSCRAIPSQSSASSFSCSQILFNEQSTNHESPKSKTPPPIVQPVQGFIPFGVRKQASQFPKKIIPPDMKNKLNRQKMRYREPESKKRIREVNQVLIRSVTNRNSVPVTRTISKRKPEIGTNNYSIATRRRSYQQPSLAKIVTVDSSAGRKSVALRNRVISIPLQKIEKLKSLNTDKKSEKPETKEKKSITKSIIEKENIEKNASVNVPKKKTVITSIKQKNSPGKLPESTLKTFNTVTTRMKTSSIKGNSNNAELSQTRSGMVRRVIVKKVCVKRVNQETKQKLSNIRKKNNEKFEFSSDDDEPLYKKITKTKEVTPAKKKIVSNTKTHDTRSKIKEKISESEDQSEKNSTLKTLRDKPTSLLSSRITRFNSNKLPSGAIAKSKSVIAVRREIAPKIIKGSIALREVSVLAKANYVRKVPASKIQTRKMILQKRMKINQKKVASDNNQSKKSGSSKAELGSTNTVTESKAEIIKSPVISKLEKSFSESDDEPLATKINETSVKVSIVDCKHSLQKESKEKTNVSKLAEKVNSKKLNSESKDNINTRDSKNNLLIASNVNLIPSYEESLKIFGIAHRSMADKEILKNKLPDKKTLINKDSLITEKNLELQDSFESAQPYKSEVKVRRNRKFMKSKEYIEQWLKDSAQPMIDRTHNYSPLSKDRLITEVNFDQENMNFPLRSNYLVNDSIPIMKPYDFINDKIFENQEPLLKRNENKSVNCSKLDINNEICNIETTPESLNVYEFDSESEMINTLPRKFKDMNKKSVKSTFTPSKTISDTNNIRPIYSDTSLNTQNKLTDNGIEKDKKEIENACIGSTEFSSTDNLNSMISDAMEYLKNIPENDALQQNIEFGITASNSIQNLSNPKNDYSDSSSSFSRSSKKRLLDFLSESKNIKNLLNQMSTNFDKNKIKPPDKPSYLKNMFPSEDITLQSSQSRKDFITLQNKRTELPTFSENIKSAFTNTITPRNEHDVSFSFLKSKMEFTANDTVSPVSSAPKSESKFNVGDITTSATCGMNSNITNFQSPYLPLTPSKILSTYSSVNPVARVLPVVQTQPNMNLDLGKSSCKPLHNYSGLAQERVPLFQQGVNKDSKDVQIVIPTDPNMDMKIDNVKHPVYFPNSKPQSLANIPLSVVNPANMQSNVKNSIVVNSGMNDLSKLSNNFCIPAKVNNKRIADLDSFDKNISLPVIKDTVELAPDNIKNMPLKPNTGKAKGSEDHLFYIPLQGVSKTGVDMSNHMIEGVAVKMDTQGPNGPQQRVIMRAKLVKKSQIKDVKKNAVKQTGPMLDMVRSVREAFPEATIHTETTIESPNAEINNIGKVAAVPSFKRGSPSSKKSQGIVGAGSQQMSSKSSTCSSQSSSSALNRSLGKSLDGIEAINFKNNTNFPQLEDPAQIVEAPIFQPTEKEFQDPLEFIERISPIAARYGLCKIIPPSSFKSECKVLDDMRFTPHNQYLHRMLYRWGPSSREMCAIKKYLATQSVNFKQPPTLSGIEVDLPKLYHVVQNMGGLKKVLEKEMWHKVAEEMCLPQNVHFMDIRLDEIYCKYLLPYDTMSADERKRLFDSVDKEWEKRQQRMMARAINPLNYESDQDEEYEITEDVEECITRGRSTTLSSFIRTAKNTMTMQFGKIQQPSPEEVETKFWEYVTNQNSHVCVSTGSIDSSAWGYGFPSVKTKSCPIARHPWNLKVLTNNSGSVLRSLGPLMGVTVPTLHVGMLFSTCCWYRDPHGLPWIEYLHEGAPKMWYGIPDSQSAKFKETLSSIVPTYCQKKTIWLLSDTTMVPPTMLTDHGVSLCRTIQNPGEFILVFPKAFTSSICTGYSVSESVYFALNSWLDTAQQDFIDIRDSCEPPMFSLERLIVAISEDIRTPLPVLKKVLPALTKIIHIEKQHRDVLFNIGLKVSERAQSVTVGRKKLPKQQEEAEECHKCRSSLSLSMLCNDSDGSVYCLLHGAEFLTTNPSHVEKCKLIYMHSIDELQRLLTKLIERINTLANKKCSKVK